jgi:import receptor subunit TOM20
MFHTYLAQQRREAKKLAQAHKVTFNSHKDSSSFTLPEDPVPETQEGREAYFMKNLQLGEQLMMQGNHSIEKKLQRIMISHIIRQLLILGPAAHDAAATCFYRALVVYPEPQKLLEVLAQSLPEVVLQLVVQKMAAEVRKTQAKFEEIE